MYHEAFTNPFAVEEPANQPPDVGTHQLAAMPLALTALVLMALTAFWAIGTDASVRWDVHGPLPGTPPAGRVIVIEMGSG